MFLCRFAPHDIQVPKQAIEVPKILIDELSVQTPVREPQLAEQLVEAPSIVSLIDVIRQPVEQIVDIPVPHGESPQGFLPRHGSTDSTSSSRVPAGAVDEPFQGGFRTFHQQKKVRRSPAPRGRNWVRTSAHDELGWRGRRWSWH